MAFMTGSRTMPKRPVHPDLAARIAVDHDEDGAAAGARGGPVQGEFLAQHRGWRGHHDGEVRRQAAGHHRVDCDHFRGDRPSAHRLHADEVIRRQDGAVETRAHRGFGRGHDGEPVGPAARVEELLDGEDAVRVMDCGQEFHGSRLPYLVQAHRRRSLHRWQGRHLRGPRALRIRRTCLPVRQEGIPRPDPGKSGLFLKFLLSASGMTGICFWSSPLSGSRAKGA